MTFTLPVTAIIIYIDIVSEVFYVEKTEYNSLTGSFLENPSLTLLP